MYQKKWSNCNECESKQLYADLIKKKIIILSEKEFGFCCESCESTYKSRIKDNIINFMVEHNEIYNLDNDSEKHKNEIELLKAEIDDLIQQSKNYYEGYVEGVFDSLKNGNVCPYCEVRTIQSVHHIIPRSFGGLDIPENLIALCRSCHDKVEILTDLLLKRDNRYDTHQLRSYILNNNFPVEVDK